MGNQSCFHVNGSVLYPGRAFQALESPAWPSSHFSPLVLRVPARHFFQEASTLSWGCPLSVEASSNGTLSGASKRTHTRNKTHQGFLMSLLVFPVCVGNLRNLSYSWHFHIPCCPHILLITLNISWSHSCLSSSTDVICHHCLSSGPLDHSISPRIDLFAS